MECSGRLAQKLNFQEKNKMGTTSASAVTSNDKEVIVTMNGALQVLASIKTIKDAEKKELGEYTTTVIRVPKDKTSTFKVNQIIAEIQKKLGYQLSMDAEGDDYSFTPPEPGTKGKQLASPKKESVASLLMDAANTLFNQIDRASKMSEILHAPDAEIWKAYSSVPDDTKPFVKTGFIQAAKDLLAAGKLDSEAANRLIARIG